MKLSRKICEYTKSKNSLFSFLLFFLCFFFTHISGIFSIQFREHKKEGYNGLIKTNKGVIKRAVIWVKTELRVIIKYNWSFILLQRLFLERRNKNINIAHNSRLFCKYYHIQVSKPRNHCGVYRFYWKSFWRRLSECSWKIAYFLPGHLSNTRNRSCSWVRQGGFERSYIKKNN